MDPYFFKVDEKIGTEAYYKVLRWTILPWLKKNYPRNNYVWTQDGAPSHMAGKVQMFCKENFANFWDKTFWPPSSLDLNPLDYSIWSILEAKVGKTSHRNVDELKACITKNWDMMSEDYIWDTCSRFCSRVEAAIAAEGGHIE